MKTKTNLTSVFAVAMTIAATGAIVSSCSVARIFTYWFPEIDDHKIFHSVELTPPPTPFTFIEGTPEARQQVASIIVESDIWRGTGADTLGMPLEQYLAHRSTTTAFLVIRNDSILFENYYGGYDRTKISTVFSVSKSVTSLMTGIAVDEGYIESVHDPVTKYIPELSKKDPRWDRLTVEHLLDMRSGFKFKETYSNFFSKSAALYYGVNHLGKMKRMRFESEPGAGDDNGFGNYQSATTAMLGLVEQLAVGRNMAEYMQDKVWTPMGMENRATWSIDDRRHRMTKSDSGLNTTARDLAKIGRLYLHHGNWNGTQIVDSLWVARSITPNAANRGYQYQWYSFSGNLINPDTKDTVWGDSADSAAENAAESLKEGGYTHWTVYQRDGGWRVRVYPGYFFAQGINGQFIWVDPAKNLIIIRLGEKWDRGVSTLIYRTSEEL
ncbi:MAG: beta-lactamase family protein [Alistipes sp.]|jgi:CubicO group peptidase (beta-lactamase class C family)|nr:beta-lactamase family protein [Alistipes sp.]